MYIDFENLTNTSVNQISSISRHGYVRVVPELEAYAHSIKLQNYKTNTVKGFQRQFEKSNALDHLMGFISWKMNIPFEKLEPVFFSVCKGAAEHVDTLGPEFTDCTILIPIILPLKSKAILKVGEFSNQIREGMVIKFNHTLPHSLLLDDTESGATVLMIAIKL